MDERSDWEIKPDELGPVSLAFFKVLIAVGISLPILLCSYGLISFFFLGIR